MTEPTIQDMMSWPLPNYVNPHTRRGLLLAIDIPCLVIMTFFVASRLSSKISKKITISIDDWVMLLAWVLAVSATVVDLVSIHYGTGVHLWDMKSVWVPMAGKLALATQALFAPCVGLTKMSIRMTYLRLFPSQANRRFYEGAVLYVINIIEINFGVVCGSLPGAKPVIRCCFPARFGSSHGDSYGSSRKRPARDNSFPFQEISNEDVRPIGAITVKQDIQLYRVPTDKTGYGASAGSAASRDIGVRAASGDAGSEDWIFNPHSK
ncbi:hypothetical protein AOQ84DRAFT_388014 [Glonium stellatum]|uniref:Rhodopsin domain-containing protein n=1 Tax=Glonium stellatum TaxID=574774 RepID=A0A8E2F386_9PEZI|nr:hypothetical protein AOQ84DRAFT_388014 [Glonium stellatum]